MKIEIDVEQFANDIKSGKSIGGANGALGSLIKQLTEAALAAEIDSHLAQDLSNNRKNGYTASNGLVFHSFSIGIILSVTALIVAFEKPTQ